MNMMKQNKTKRIQNNYNNKQQEEKQIEYRQTINKQITKQKQNNTKQIIIIKKRWVIKPTFYYQNAFVFILH